jgi:hypothetical protein
MMSKENNILTAVMGILGTHKKALNESVQQKKAAHDNRIRELSESIASNRIPVVHLEHVDGVDAPFLWSDLIELGYARTEGKKHYLNEHCPVSVELVTIPMKVLQEEGIDLPEGVDVRPGECYSESNKTVTSDTPRFVVEDHKNEHIIMQVRSSMDTGNPLVFKDTSTVRLSSEELARINTYYENIVKPADKTQFVHDVQQTAANILRYI